MSVADETWSGQDEGEVPFGGWSLAWLSTVMHGNGCILAVELRPGT